MVKAPKKGAAGLMPGPWTVESRGTGEYDVIGLGNRRVAGYMRLPEARLMAAAPQLRSAMEAVLFQLEQGEASDALDIGIFGDGTQDDLRWCRDQIREALKSLS